MNRYIAIARKYRPKKFADILGQEHIIRSLSNCILNNELHHAYLFSGIRGVGKTTIARIFAKCLTCEGFDGITTDPCNKCSACLEIDDLSSFDVIEIDAATRTKVEEIKEILNNIKYLPGKSRYKIYIIDEVHMLSNSSFNALLKTLEEPPEYVKFLLASTEPNKLPKTILSRCINLHLRKVNNDLILSNLDKIMNERNIKCEYGSLELLVKIADGSVRDSLTLLEQVIMYCGDDKEIKKNDINTIFGLLDASIIEKIIHLIIIGDINNIIKILEEINLLGCDLKFFLQSLFKLFNDILLSKIIKNNSSILNKVDFNKFSDSFNINTIEAYLLIINKGIINIGFHSDKNVYCQTLLTRLVLIKTSSLKLEGHDKKNDGNSIKTFETKYLNKQIKNPISNTKFINEYKWKEFLNFIKNDNDSIYSLLEQCDEKIFNESKILLSYDYSKKGLLNNSLIDFVNKLLLKYFNRVIEFRIKFKNNSYYNNSIITNSSEYNIKNEQSSQNVNNKTRKIPLKSIIENSGDNKTDITIKKIVDKFNGTIVTN